MMEKKIFLFLILFYLLIFFWLLFQGGKEDNGVRNYDGNKSKSLYKRSRIKSTKALIDGSVQEIVKSGKISQ